MWIETNPRLYRTACIGYNCRSGKFFAQRTFGEGFHRSPRGGSDMDVRGLGATSGAFPLRSAQPLSKSDDAKSSPKPTSPRDELDLSAAGKMLEQIHSSSSPGELRQQRLARIKAEIDAGTYDTDEKLEAALSRMLDTLGFGEDD